MTRSEALRVLGLPDNYDEAMLKHAFRAAAKRAHPDIMGGSEEAMLRVNEANRVLSDLQTAVSKMLVTHNGILDVVLVQP